MLAFNQRALDEAKKRECTRKREREPVDHPSHQLADAFSSRVDLSRLAAIEARRLAWQENKAPKLPNAGYAGSMQNVECAKQHDNPNYTFSNHTALVQAVQAGSNFNPSAGASLWEDEECTMTAKMDSKRVFMQKLMQAAKTPSYSGNHSAVHILFQSYFLDKKKLHSKQDKYTAFFCIFCTMFPKTPYKWDDPLSQVPVAFRNFLLECSTQNLRPFKFLQDTIVTHLSNTMHMYTKALMDGNFLNPTNVETDLTLGLFAPLWRLIYHQATLKLMHENFKPILLTATNEMLFRIKSYSNIQNAVQEFSPEAVEDFLKPTEEKSMAPTDHTDTDEGPDLR